MPTAYAPALAGALGLILGSFFNVVIHRLPRRESVVWPRSRCPECSTAIRALDNIPVLSYLLLRGRCRHCDAPIHWRYPAVEATTAVLAVALVLDKGVGRHLWLPAVLIALLVPIAMIDLERQIVPNRLTGPGAVAALLIGAAVDRHHVPEQLIAAAAAGGFLLLAALLYPKGMGMGDVKLVAMMGLFLGRDVAVALMVALVAGTAVGAVLFARHGADARRRRVPFAPFLALGGVVAIFAGPPVVHWYLNTFA